MVRRRHFGAARPAVALWRNAHRLPARLQDCRQPGAKGSGPECGQQLHLGLLGAWLVREQALACFGHRPRSRPWAGGKALQRHGQPAMTRKILVIRRDNIGDLVCTTPMIRMLRQHYPDAWIAALVTRYNAEVLAGNPDLDAVFAYQKAK